MGEEAAQAGLLSYCKTPLGGGQVAFWTKLGTCLGYSLLSAGGDPAAANKAGITGLCDVFFVSSCSMFAALNGELLDPVDCIPEPDNETLCSFANLG